MTMTKVKQLNPKPFYWALLGMSVITALILVRFWSWWKWALSPVEQGNTTENVKFQVKPGTYGQQIGQELEKAGLIRSASAWNYWSKLEGMAGKNIDFQAGTYEISPSQPMDAIAQKILSGDVVKVDFTIREGWSIKDMAEYLEKQGFFPAADFIAASQKIPYDKYPWLPQGIPHLEGYLFPDTYKIAGDQITPEGIIDVMLNHFQQVALPLYEKGKDQVKNVKNLQEWVTLASIVEKEAVVGSERKTISGVYHNRLEKGMQLGADPTVEYGLGVKQTKEKPLTFAQVAIPNPYNTYINFGLPPTAIASPGLASLEATLYPEQTDYLYFMARYDGTHIFSRTAAEHEAAISQVEKMLGE